MRSIAAYFNSIFVDETNVPFIPKLNAQKAGAHIALVGYAFAFNVETSQLSNNFIVVTHEYTLSFAVERL